MIELRSVLYILAFALFIHGLMGLTGPRTAVRGNAYGCYDAVRAIAHLGIQGSEGTALCGAEYRDLPNTLGIDIRTDRLAAQPSSPQALFGIRIDYVLADVAAKSVLWHGGALDDRRSSP